MNELSFLILMTMREQDGRFTNVYYSHSQNRAVICTNDYTQALTFTDKKVAESVGLTALASHRQVHGFSIVIAPD